MFWPRRAALSGLNGGRWVADGAEEFGGVAGGEVFEHRHRHGAAAEAADNSSGAVDIAAAAGDDAADGAAVKRRVVVETEGAEAHVAKGGERAAVATPKPAAIVGATIR